MNWIIENKKYIFSAVIILYIISVLYNLGYTELDGEEPRRALISIEMLHSKNFISPSLYGWAYFNKPPMFNWVMGLAMFMFNSSSEWVVRLPSLIFALIWGFVHYRLMNNFLPQKVAALSAVFLLTCGEIYFYGLQNGGEIDIFYAFIVYLQVITMFYFYEKGRGLPLFVFSYFLCAVGFLTKGFPSGAFQLLSLISLAVYAKSFRLLFKWQHLAGIIIFTLVVGGYLFIYNYYNSPQHLIINLLQESINKTPLKEAADEMPENIWRYPVQLFISLLPWSLLLLLLLNRRIKVGIWNYKVLRFSILFIVCNIWIYWFLGMMKARYSYMFFPFFCTILAHLFYTYKQTINLKSVFKYLGFLFVIIIAASLVISFLKPEYFLHSMLVALFLTVFVVFYFKAYKGIWSFVSGLVLVRLAYAILFMPVMYANTKSIKYRHHINNTSALNKNEPLSFYAPPDTLSVEVDMKFYKWGAGKIITPPEIFKQVPYYYYQATGHIVNYDTSIQKNKKYFGYREDLENEKIKEIHSFFDNRMDEEFVLFEKGL